MSRSTNSPLPFVTRLLDLRAFDLGLLDARVAAAVRGGSVRFADGLAGAVGCLNTGHICRRFRADSKAQQPLSDSYTP